MNIIEATKKALEENKLITRESNHMMTYIPTNSSVCYVVVPIDSKMPSTRRWNPNVDDILADDWKVAN